MTGEWRMRYVAALDQGTTSSRALVIDENGAVRGRHGIEFAQIYPQPGWVEHDPMEILRSQTDALQAAVQKAGIDPRDLAAVGIANQRETTLLWERDTGRPVSNAIVWQCRRTAPTIARLGREGLHPLLREKTGLVPDAYFSGSKLAWILDHVPGARARAQRGELCFGTVDSWLLWHLSRERHHATDDTNASRTMLYNLRNGGWDEELLDIFNVPRTCLPEILPSSGYFGELHPDVLGVPVPICAVAGDQHAALFGQACFAPGMVKNTYGTGCFLLMNTGCEPVCSRHQLLSTVAWSTSGPSPEGRREFALEGSVFTAGAAVQWLRDELRLIDSAARSEELALSVPDTGGVYLVPAFTGLGAPHWDMYARGTLVGLTRGAGRAHIVRAALEAVALQTADVLAAMREDSGLPIAQLRADGGASANNFLMQFQADVLGARVLRPAVTESTAMGAAFMAGLAAGIWPNREAVAALWREERAFEPAMTSAQREQVLAGWRRAVDCARHWAQG